jgi:hypothetical protein
VTAPSRMSACRTRVLPPPYRRKPPGRVPFGSVLMTATAKRCDPRALWVANGRQVLRPRWIRKLTTLVGERGEGCLAAYRAQNLQLRQLFMEIGHRCDDGIDRTPIGKVSRKVTTHHSQLTHRKHSFKMRFGWLVMGIRSQVGA